MSLYPRNSLGHGGWDHAKSFSIGELSAAYGISLKQGSNRCPFQSHYDARASFLYNRDQNRFICFGCGQRGSAIDFIATLLSISLQEAVETILARSGRTFAPVKKAVSRHKIKLPPSEYRIDPEIYGVVASLSPLAKSGRMYLHNRKIGDQTIDHFSICQIGRPNELLAELQSQFTNERLIKSGIVQKGVDLRIVFKSSDLLFPFMEGASCVYLQARSIDPSRTRPRWMGLRGVKKPIYNSRALEGGTVYICEGITDVLSAHELGFGAIGVLGAGQGLRPNLIDDLLGKTIYIVADNDEAGLRMAKATSGQLAKAGVASKIQRVPIGKDLNDYIIHLGAQNGT